MQLPDSIENLAQIDVWVQMFFVDGSVSMGVRVDAAIFDDDRELLAVGEKLLKTTRRDEGVMMVWGAGTLGLYKINLYEASKALKTLALVSETL